MCGVKLVECTLCAAKQSKISTQFCLFETLRCTLVEFQFFICMSLRQTLPYSRRTCRAVGGVGRCGDDIAMMLISGFSRGLLHLFQRPLHPPREITQDV